MKTALVCGAGGFIGGHLVKRLKAEGFLGARRRSQISGVRRDRSRRLRHRRSARSGCSAASVIDRRFDEVYQLAADMGGAGYIFTGEHDADVMHNSATINLNVLDACRKRRHQAHLLLLVRLHVSGLQPGRSRQSELRGGLGLSGRPDSEYGWEKLFSERLYLAYAPQLRHGGSRRRFHNIFGPEGTWAGGKEKAPAAICRKVAEAPSGRRDRDLGRRQADPLVSLYRRMPRRHHAPDALGLSLGRSISARRRWSRSTSSSTSSPTSPARRRQACIFTGPLGVRGRNSDNELIRQSLGWQPSQPLRGGMQKTYAWIATRVADWSGHNSAAA